MQITLNQDEIESALRAHITSQVNIREDQELALELKAGRGENGFSAILDIRTPTSEPAAEPAAKEPAVKKPRKTKAKKAAEPAAEKPEVANQNEEDAPTENQKAPAPSAKNPFAGGDEDALEGEAAPEAESEDEDEEKQETEESAAPARAGGIFSFQKPA